VLLELAADGGEVRAVVVGHVEGLDLDPARVDLVGKRPASAVDGGVRVST